MSTFIYSAAKQNGEAVKGEQEAESKATLASLLKQQGLFLLDAREKGAKDTTFGKLNFNIGEIATKLKPISIVDKMFFTRNLAVMLGAGLALTKALDALEKQTANGRLKIVIADVKDNIVRGKPFAESLHAHEKIFGELYVNMIEVGETTGKLTLVLRLLAKQIKKDYDLRKRVRGAMIYPAIILSVLIMVGTLMMIYVVPQLTQTILDLGVELPLSTRVIIFISEIISNYILWIILGAAAWGVLFWYSLKTAPGKRIFDTVVLKVPIFGPLINKFNTARFSRILSYLISSGIPIVRSLEITAGVLGNIHFRNAAETAAVEVQKGKQIHQILSAFPVFQPMVLQMIEVGEETGKISSMLLRLAIFFEDEVSNTTKNLASIIEPILMVVIGIAVGFFAISMLQPIYSSLGNIK
ncbi:MAG: hypothetical protein A2847_00270 [Candidatus Sungbacteria bacterium RIFCSPHIGHO2_01_FULL_50_25]|uniref:Type II secretion system protein GspF domain-containing protein n=1 Tax=Candidatus Sungbacteria bacterium RIFCSPHIGHO2_01_FULL_50_25 TaxID=1802265 RepID=A0A1G2KDK7_9BACT|nr:MAG: hypothetical protein A2847_00270 [Candidatus Sungbacteria bacterium RIFCSPHIGHO2_01_FULL_50_25]